MMGKESKGAIVDGSLAGRGVENSPHLSPALNIALLYFFIMSEFSLAFYRKGGGEASHGLEERRSSPFWRTEENGGFNSQSLYFRPHQDTREEEHGTFNSGTAGHGRDSITT